ncbi:PWWP domain-containing protein 1 isoform X1 [Musa acuminata AAA Group]|uniref:PWWP domain-containing protein 1 isoform X1 n=1 Tax=Musa acuminata AAA Group TaxID=214697 RepID=UPI0031DA3338
MISVMSEREIDRGSAAASFGMGNPQEGPASDEAAADGVGRGSRESRVPMELDLVERKIEVDSMVLERGEADLSRSPKDAPGGEDAAMDEARVPESDVAEGVSASAGAGAMLVMADPEGGSDFDEGLLSDEVSVSNGATILQGAVGNWMNGFELGDMVWGKVKSHPWWPGHIFNEAFASASVRRTKKEGHFLVAFFGDSSYGWFEPAELVPFDPHYEEKSKQTTLRPFVKAVEEAVDEASRREALALTCYCRNPFNFQPARVPGYFYVDVPGFELGGIYSLKQVNSARDKFVPVMALSFLQQTATSPLADDPACIDRMRNVAMMLAYRRAVFEEFDETYAQAFGVEPVRPSRRTGAMPDQLERFAPRAAPLSGPLVLPEPLRHKKSSSHKLVHKAAKVPSAKKNKYVLKRRDEREPASASVGPPKPSLPDVPSPVQSHRNHYNLFPAQQHQQTPAHHAPHAHPTLVFQDASCPPASAPGGSNLGDYVLQKRAPAGAADEKPPPQTSQDGSVSEQTALPAAADAPAVRQVFDEGRLKTEPPRQLSEIAHRKLDPTVSGAAYSSADAKPGYGPGSLALRTSQVGGIMKEKKIKKRLREDGSSAESGVTGQAKKKKKKKKVQSSEIGVPDHVKASTIEDLYRRSAAAKPVSMEPELPRREDEVAPTTEPSAVAVRHPDIDLSLRDLQLPELVSDLQELALYPFYGIDRDAPWVALHVFLNFRSLVYQKSLGLPPASEADAPEVPAVKPSAALPPPQEPVVVSAVVAPAKVTNEETAPTSISKPPKASFRPDDPTVAGRKRTASDRQEEMSAKRQKKLDTLKALAGEKKAAIGHKGLEGPQRGQKDPVAATTSAAASAGPAKPNDRAAEPVKKQEPPPPPRLPSPTTLVMKFPLRTTLPSVASLKAKFARFGPLELSGTRVYWKSYTCKVVYKFKPDAEAALNHARSNQMFGQVKVYYYLRDADALAPEPSSEAVGQRSESRLVESNQFRPGSGAGVGVSFGPSRPPLNLTQKPAGQPKSILKKPSDEAAPSGGGREAPRVKFMLDTVDGKAELPATVVVAGNNNDVRSSADTSSAVDPVIGKAPRSVRFLPPPSSSRPLIPFPPRADSPYIPPPPASLGVAERVLPPPRPQRNLNGVEEESGSSEQRGNANKAFADQMLSLLFRCRDIVRNVKSSLGYVPYHQL